MNKATNIFLLVYYLFGTFCLPMSNFALVSDLPQMYHHCKDTEDKDLTPTDFVTDHLLNFDRLFDKHNHGDDQKPHKNSEITFHNAIIQIFQKPEIFEFKNNVIVVSNLKVTNFKKDMYSHILTSCIFRPPILV